MTSSIKRLLSQAAIVALVFLAAAGLQTFAFTEPTQTPPGGNVDAPLNTGSAAQDKTGFLTADNIGSSFGAYLGTGSCSTASDCYVGIGTVSPAAKLDVRGPILASDTSTTCGSTIKGAIRYNSTSGGLEWCDGSAWSSIGSGGSGSPGGLDITTANTFNYNVATALGNPTSPVNTTVTIEPWVIVGSTNPSTPALTTGSLPAGSTVTIVNKGKIEGAGGAGGRGGIDNGCSGGSATAGGQGGIALLLTVATTLDNTAGIIYGGGGGGGAGGSVSDGSQGGGGGGGGGINAGSGGSAGGSSGSASSGGSGGGPTGIDPTGNYNGGGNGGSGGNPGQAGSPGNNPSTAPSGWYGCPYTNGGAAGYSISGTTNLTWSSSNHGTVAGPTN